MKGIWRIILSFFLLSTVLRPAVADPAAVDPRALALIQKVAQTIQSIHSLTADEMERYKFLTLDGTATDEMTTAVTLKVMRPADALIVVSYADKSAKTGKWSKEHRSLTFMADGTNLVTLDTNDSYQKEPVQAAHIPIWFATPLLDFFNAKFSAAATVADEQKNRCCKN